MKMALSTNWCNRRFERGEDIVEAALRLGFDALELGFRTTADQARGIKRRLEEIPVGSVHAFCPVPLSAPVGHPELYSIVADDENERAMARFHLQKTIAFAAEMGAQSVVLHAGRVDFSTFLRRGFSTGDLRKVLVAAGGDVKAKAYRRLLRKALVVRRARGRAKMDMLVRELEGLSGDLQRYGVVLALENLPYLEAFPNEPEMALLRRRLAGAPVAAWFDTGHHRVRQSHGWFGARTAAYPLSGRAEFVGMHLNDVVDFDDDHLPPGEGKVDFAALKPLSRCVRHVVVESNNAVDEPRLQRALAFLRELWR